MIEYFKGKYYRQLAYLYLAIGRKLDKRLTERRPHIEKALMCNFVDLSETVSEALEKQKKTFDPKWNN